MGSGSTSIDGIKPLETQLGVLVPKTVPDVLFEPFFGSPTIHTYAILDAAKVVNLSELLAGSDLLHRCLFKGAAFDEFKDVAPWIVRLEDGNDFTRNLFTQSDAPWHLWDKAQGMYVQSTAAFDDIWAHFRKFTKVRDPNGKWYYFRFWEADFTAGLLQNGDPATATRLLSIGSILTCNPKAGTLNTFSSVVTDDAKPHTAFSLRDADLAALRDVSTRQFAQRLSAWIIATYDDAPIASEMDDIAYQGIRQAQDVLGLRDERSVADYVAASWLLGHPAETRYDLRKASNLGHVLSVAHREARKYRYSHV